MAKSICKPTLKEKDSLIEKARQWQKNPYVKQMTKHDRYWEWNTFRKMVGQSMGGSWDYKSLPNAKQQVVLDSIIKDNVKAITRKQGKDANFIERLFYLPHVMFRNTPLAKTMEDMQITGESFKGSSSYLNREMIGVNDLLFKSQGETGAKNYIMQKVTGKSSSQRKLQKMFDKYYEAKQKKDIKVADELYYGTRGKPGIIQFLKSDEGRVFADFQQLASANKADWAELTSRTAIRKMEETVAGYGKTVEAARIFRDKIQPGVQDFIIDGIRLLEKSLTKSQSIYEKAGFAKREEYNKIIKNAKDLRKRLESDELKENGFFPVLSLDILPSLAEVTKKMNLAKNRTEFLESASVLDKLDSILENNIYFQKIPSIDIDGTAKRDQTAVNNNIIPIMDSYIRSGTRFGFASANTAHYIDALQKIHQISKHKDKGYEELNASLEGMKDYLSEQYSVAVGAKHDPNAISTKITRAITSWEFTSKLGLNFRSTFRNSTQAALHWVVFGKKGISETSEMMKNEDMAARVNQGLKDNGIRFAELEENLGGKSSIYDYIDLNESTGAFSKKIDIGIAAKVTEGLAKLAEQTGRPMQWVENNVNRRWAYELGFTQSWKADQNRLPYLRDKFERINSKKIEQWKETEESTNVFGKKDTKYNIEFEKWRQKRTDKWARRFVRQAHFDYSAIAKSPYARTKTGSILGQFQHYGFNFLDFQMQVGKSGGRDLMSGQIDTNSTRTMFRLSMLYTVANAILSPLTNADFGNIVQNDTWERISSYNDAMFGDDKEKEKAFFGKGPIIGTFAGPFAGDVMTIGNTLGFWKMDENSMLGYVGALQDEADLSGNEMFQELARTVSSSAYRLFYQTIPALDEGQNLGTAIQYDLGLRSTPRVEEARNRLRPFVKPFGLTLENPNQKITPTAPGSINAGALKSLDKLQGL